MMFERTFNPEVWAAVPFHFWSLCFFAFGCTVGSFLNVCIHRMPLNQSVVSPPSHCPHCKYSIPWYLNVPLLTWVWLRGRCANCHAPISPRYLLVELLTGVLFLATWLAHGVAADPLPSLAVAAALCLLVAGLVVGTFIDLEHYIIPDEITIGGAVAGFLLSLLIPSLHGVELRSDALLRSGLGIALGAGILYGMVWMGKLLFGRQQFRFEPGTRVEFTDDALVLPDREIPYEDVFYRRGDSIEIPDAECLVYLRNDEAGGNPHHLGPAMLRLTTAKLTIGDAEFDPQNVARVVCAASEVHASREAMGFGDVKFLAAIGAFLGATGAVFSIMASAVVGSIVAVTLIMLGRRAASEKIPYGPYIAFAAMLWIVWGAPIYAFLFPQ